MTINDLFAGICKEDIWNADETWNSNVPCFSRCLRQTLLTWIPCFFLIIFSLFQFYTIYSSKPKASSWRLLNASRLFFTIVAIFANLVEFGFFVGKYMKSSDNYPYILFVSSALKVFTFVIVAVILLYLKSNGVPTSGVIWLFFLIHIICFIPTIIQLCLHEDKLRPFEFNFNIFYFWLLIKLFILSSFADLPSKRQQNFVKLDDDSDDEPIRPTCPESNSSFLSQLLYWWYNGVVYLGYKKTLVTNDIFDLNEEEKSVNVIPVFEKNWITTGSINKPETTTSEDEVQFVMRTTNRSILKAILKSYWPQFLIAGIILTLSLTSFMAGPVLLGALLRFISSDEPMWHGFMIGIAMVSIGLTSSFCNNYYYLLTTKIQVKAQSCITNLIYQKSLRISAQSKKSSTAGEVVNLMSVDTQRILDQIPFILFVFGMPIMLIVSFYLMYKQVGYAAFGGLIVLLVSAPITYFSATFARKYQIKQMKLKDERVKHLNEILNGMKVLKLYAWEPSFIKIINEIRVNEMNASKLVSYFFSVAMFLWTFAPFMVAVVTFAIFIFSDSNHVLTAEHIFVTLNLIELLRFPMSILPQLISFSVMCYVSAKRIDKYLNAPELVPYVTRNNSEFAVEVKGGHFRWELDEENKDESDSKSEDKKNDNNNKNNVDEKKIDNGIKKAANSNNIEILSDINMNVSVGSLHAIVGQVGSGKSSLLSAILGEIEKVKGSVNIKQDLKIAYVAQQAWIENLTLRDNILFGRAYNKEKYEKILDVCALRPDLEVLPAGDLTEIGEKGINLSGGQKQRVALARACYSDADLFLFDDPLSAVDAHVAKHLFNNVFHSRRGLLKSATRILVTNRLDVLPKVDFVTVLKDGKVSEQGTYPELMEKDAEFADFINQYLSGGERKQSVVRQFSKQESVAESVDEKVEEKKKDTLIEEETAEVGSVSWNVYTQYLKLISIGWIILIVIGVGGYHVTSVTANVWLSQWSHDNVTGNVEHDEKQKNYRFGIYCLIGVMQTFSVMCGNIAVIKAGLQSSISLHAQLLYRVFRSPMSFFDTTPLGRILNRFSKDMDSVDQIIPMYIREVLFRIFEFVFAMGVIASQTGIFCLVILPVIIGYYFVQRIFIPASRQLQRLQSITRSPVYAHFSQTLQGVSTIRAFDENKRFITESDKRVELNLMCFYAMNIGYRWLNVILAAFGSFVVFFVAMYATVQRDLLTAGMVGLSVTYALTITQTLTWMVRCAAMVETNIVSVERIKEYCENETEAEWTIEDRKPAASWPNNGAIEFSDYATRYRQGLDLVLNQMSAVVKPTEKVGIVGRTGAGKSTITLSLFRIIEAADGEITIDNINIATIGLHDLRSKLTIIPQDPVLFAGTLRFNLDPFDAYNDDQIWEALEQSHLKQFVSGLEKGLLHDIAEGGENLSVGQRQLVCLARALLRKTKILILDEATAAVDMETDSLIQSTIRSEFSNCTTLTIAHRIQTILDYDRVMVLDKGKVIEFDSPNTLLANQNTVFYSLAKNAGIVS